MHHVQAIAGNIAETLRDNAILGSNAEYGWFQLQMSLNEHADDSQCLSGNLPHCKTQTSSQKGLE